MAINDNLKYLRNKFSKKQPELAAVLGIAQSSYSNYENGNREIGIADAIKLADYFGISVERLIRDNLWEDTQGVVISGPIGVITNHGHIAHNNPVGNNNTLPPKEQQDLLNEVVVLRLEVSSLRQRIVDLSNSLLEKDETIQAQKQLIQLLQKKD